MKIIRILFTLVALVCTPAFAADTAGDIEKSSDSEIQIPDTILKPLGGQAAYDNLPVLDISDLSYGTGYICVPHDRKMIAPVMKATGTCGRPAIVIKYKNLKNNEINIATIFQRYKEDSKFWIPCGNNSLFHHGSWDTEEGQKALAELIGGKEITFRGISAKLSYPTKDLMQEEISNLLNKADKLKENLAALETAEQEDATNDKQYWFGSAVLNETDVDADVKEDVAEDKSEL